MARPIIWVQGRLAGQTKVQELGKLHVDYCFNCGSCTFVCPAKRPCTQMMGLAKAFYLGEIKKGGNK